MEFLNKMPNPGILKSGIWGETEFEDILFLPKQFSKTSVHQPGELYFFSLNSLDASNPSWQVNGPGLILNNTANLKFKFIQFIENQVMSTAPDKYDVVRPENRVGNSNPGISTPHKMFPNSDTEHGCRIHL